MKKRVRSSLAILCLTVTVAGMLYWGLPSGVPYRPYTPMAQENIKLCVLHLSDTNRSRSLYAYAHELGISQMKAAFSLADNQILTYTNVDTPEAAENTMRQCIRNKANVIVATSKSYMATCKKLAAEFPGVLFVNATGTLYNLSNFSNYSGRSYQPFYLAGIVAGLRTRSGKIGFIVAHGKEDSEVTSAVNAFAIGCERVNPKARIHVRQTIGWYDPEGETLATRLLIASGNDIIAQYSDTPNPILEAQRSGILAIGHGNDMRDVAPQTTLASIVWRWDVYYRYLLRSLIEGSFTPHSYRGGLSDGIVDIFVNETLLPVKDIAQVQKERSLIESGKNRVFEGEFMTNTGKALKMQGEYSADTAGWYYRNVVEDAQVSPPA